MKLKEKEKNKQQSKESEKKIFNDQTIKLNNNELKIKTSLLEIKKNENCSPSIVINFVNEQKIDDASDNLNKEKEKEKDFINLFNFSSQKCYIKEMFLLNKTTQIIIKNKTDKKVLFKDMGQNKSKEIDIKSQPLWENKKSMYLNKIKETYKNHYSKIYSFEKKFNNKNLKFERSKTGVDLNENKFKKKYSFHLNINNESNLSNNSNKQFRKATSEIDYLENAYENSNKNSRKLRGFIEITKVENKIAIQLENYGIDHVKKFFINLR